MKTQPVDVEVRIQAALETVWERTHQPGRHGRWDLRFSELEYLPRVGEEEPQRFRFTTRIGLGLRIRGEGVFVGTKDARNGSRTTALRFSCPGRRALVRSGHGCWHVIPDKAATTFVTRYDYETRYGLAGALVDRFFFRPLLGSATAWSFDRLRLADEVLCSRTGAATTRTPASRGLRRSSYRAAAMPRLEIRPFSAEFVGAAGDLLAARHRLHRVAEPLLPVAYEDAPAAQREVEALLTTHGAAGAVALRESRVVGYLLGAPRPNAVWGEHVWVELAGHAVEEAEDLRDLYGAAAARWVDQGWVRQYAMVPAHDPGLLRAWWRVGFGQQHALGVREVPETAWPNDVRLAEERDVDALIALTPVLAEHQALSPIFAAGMPAEDPDELRDEILADLAKPEIADLVAERDGRVVGAFQLVPVELSSVVHAGVARPEGAALIGWAATNPEVRGAGTGLALTDAAFAWARERGHETMVTDWRVTNLLASRFWPARGFRETFLRLYRHIP